IRVLRCCACRHVLGSNPPPRFAEHVLLRSIPRLFSLRLPFDEREQAGHRFALPGTRLCFVLGSLIFLSIKSKTQDKHKPPLAAPFFPQRLQGLSISIVIFDIVYFLFCLRACRSICMPLCSAARARSVICSSLYSISAISRSSRKSSALAGLPMISIWSASTRFSSSCNLVCMIYSPLNFHHITAIPAFFPDNPGDG